MKELEEGMYVRTEKEENQKLKFQQKEFIEFLDWKDKQINKFKYESEVEDVKNQR